MAGISIRNLVKSYGKFTVLPDLSLEIADHEFVVFVGPSGCGKSTLLRIIAELEPITSGELFIGDKRVNGVPAAQRDIAMVFQDYALYPHMRVYDNMAFALELRGMPKAEIETRVRQAAAMLHIEAYLDRKPKELSGGQRQRVAMGRAIVRNPQVFLFDEPLSNLDAKLRAQVRAEIKALSQQLRTTMVFVTHDQIEAMTMADRIVVLQGGVVQQYDTPEVVYERPANQFVAGFIGSPTMNFFPVEWRGDAAVFAGDATSAPLDASLGARLRMAAGTAVVGVRPEHFQVVPAEASGIPVRIKLVEPLGSDTLNSFRNRGRGGDRARRSVVQAETGRAIVSQAAAGKDPSIRCRIRPGIAMSANAQPGVAKQRAAAGALTAGARKTRVICLGLSALDQIWRVPAFFSGGSQKIKSLEHATMGGGMAATASVAVARLGGIAAFWGRAGDDAAGREMQAMLLREGVDVSQFRLFPDGQSSVSGVLVDFDRRAADREFSRQIPGSGRLAAVARNRTCRSGAGRSALA